MLPTCRFRSGALFVVGLGLAMAGCLPFGGPSEPEELYPSDSLSREVAARTPVIELQLVNRIAPDEPSYFGSMQLGPDSLIWVADLSSSSIRRFALNGEERERIASHVIQYPYLAGYAGDTSYAYDVGTDQLFRIEGRRITARWDLPVRAGGAHLSRFVSVLDGSVFVKDAGIGERATMAISRLGESPVRIELPGPAWKYHGILESWQDRVIGISSFRPMLYLFDKSAHLDSMALTGFDSPMLARSRAFAIGEVSEPPLMISSVSTLGDRLFVLNVRPGILRVDEYDAEGMLVDAFQRESPEPDAFTPMDLLALPDGSDGLIFFVVSTLADYDAISLDYRSRLDRLEPKE